MKPGNTNHGLFVAVIIRFANAPSIQVKTFTNACNASIIGANNFCHLFSFSPSIQSADT